jgi:hypothetical protein
MAQVVSRRPVITYARVNPRAMCGGQNGTGTGFPLWLSTLICHLGDEL